MTVNQANRTNPAEFSARRRVAYLFNDAALLEGRATELYGVIMMRIEECAAYYLQAAYYSNIPAEIIFALHVNESTMGTNNKSVHGPESGFGLDPRWLSTEDGNKYLEKAGLDGPWERGTGTDNSILQSAVIAGLRLVDLGKWAGITLGETITSEQLAGLSAAYLSGPKKGKYAMEQGRSFMYDPVDPQPHPHHPGGTSKGPNGETIQVAPSIKTGLMRWDVLIPMAQALLSKSVDS